MINSLTKACKLINDQVRTRLPIQRGQLVMLLEKLDSHFETQPYLRSLYKAMYVSAYFGLLRVSEMTEGQHAIKATNIQTGVNKPKIMFMLKSSKTHDAQAGPQIVKITSEPITGTDRQLRKDPICPFSIIQEYLDRRGPAKHRDDQFFVFSDGSNVKDSHFRTNLRTILQLAGFESTAYCTHSFRIG